jgi:hypothetical protein
MSGYTEVIVRFFRSEGTHHVLLIRRASPNSTDQKELATVFIPEGALRVLQIRRDSPRSSDQKGLTTFF